MYPPKALDTWSELPTQQTDHNGISLEMCLDNENEPIHMIFSLHQHCPMKFIPVKVLGLHASEIIIAKD